MITKTKFKEFSRCKRFNALADINKHKDEAFVDYSIDLEDFYKILIDDEDFYLETADEQLEIMMPYFSQLEEEAAKTTSIYFAGEITYSLNTKDQAYFEKWNENYKFSCYVDVYVAGDNPVVIEVKGTTSSKIEKLAYSHNKEKHQLFNKVNNIYTLRQKPADEKEAAKYQKQLNKLFDRYNDLGKYVYDLAIQKWIIDDDTLIKHDYYLGVLNHNYVFDGLYEEGKPKYETVNGEELITFVDLTEIVNLYYDQIQSLANTVEAWVDDRNLDPVKLEKCCERKKTTQCKYFDTCWKDIPAKDSIYTYLYNSHGFGANKTKPFDLIADGKVSMFDIPRIDLTREINKIQREVHETGNIYFNEGKIKTGLGILEYPLYHLDFETFPAPLPRFNGEKPYTQSVFQFSLHVQNTIDQCDKDNDHFEYCSDNVKDDREDLVRAMCEYIGDTGSVIVWNQGFEKARLKELAEIFPEYKEKLLSIRERCFDLMHIFKSSSTLYKELGYSDEMAKIPNYYHKDLQGSYSIKKVLPIFSDLSYRDLEVGNGMEALITYARFPFMNKDEFEEKYQALKDYCKQDTWAMVVLLQGINELV